MHGLQIANTIKQYRPDIVIDWVVRDCFADIVRSTHLVDTVFLFHRHGGLKKFCHLLKQIQSNRYDYVFDMQGLARSAVMTMATHSKIKIGRRDARELAWLAYDKQVPLPSKRNCHALDILAQFLPILQIQPKLIDDGKMNFYPRPSSYTAKIHQTIINQQTRTILVFPESRRVEKQWPYFTELVDVLPRYFPQHTIIVLGQNRTSLSNKMQQMADNGVVDLRGKTTLHDVVFLIQQSNLVIANDSAPVHIASATNTPLIALFGPTDPQQYGPYPEFYNVLCPTNHSMQTTQNPNVSNVVLRGIKNRLSNIAVSDVILYVQTLLENKK